MTAKKDPIKVAKKGIVARGACAGHGPQVAAKKERLIKVGRKGIPVQGSRVPASFFRHRQPGKQFVVLVGEDRLLMHVRASDAEAIKRAYNAYAKSLRTRKSRVATN